MAFPPPPMRELQRGDALGTTLSRTKTDRANLSFAIVARRPILALALAVALATYARDVPAQVVAAGQSRDISQARQRILAR